MITLCIGETFSTKLFDYQKKNRHNLCTYSSCSLREDHPTVPCIHNNVTPLTIRVYIAGMYYFPVSLGGAPLEAAGKSTTFEMKSSCKS